MTEPQFDITPFLDQDEGQHFDRRAVRKTDTGEFGADTGADTGELGADAGELGATALAKFIDRRAARRKRIEQVPLLDEGGIEEMSRYHAVSGLGCACLTLDVLRHS